MVLSPNQVSPGWRDTLPKDDLDAFETWWRGLQASRKPGRTEVRFRSGGGEYRWFQISASPLLDDQGALIRWCGINIDIDERKRAEQKLQKNEEDLRTILDAIRQAVVVLAADGKSH